MTTSADSIEPGTSRFWPAAVGRAAWSGGGARLVFAAAVFVGGLPAVGWPLATAWLAAMAILIAAEQGWIPGAGDAARAAHSWLISAGYSLAALDLAWLHAGPAQTLGVTLYGVIMFEVLARDYAQPRRLLLNLVPPVASIGVLQILAAAALIARQQTATMATLLASPFVVFWVFRAVWSGLNQSRRRLVEAAEAAEAARRRIAEAHRVALMAEALAGVGHWRLDVAARAFSWTPGVYGMIGLDPAAPKPGNRALLEIWAPEERERMVALIAGAVEDGAPFTIEGDILWPGNQRRRVVANAAVERDAAGAVISVVGAVQDVTEARAREAALVASEARYRLLTENANDVVLQVDREGLITFVTPACQTLLGYSPEEMIGTRATRYSHPDDFPTIREALRAYIARGPGAEPMVTQYRAVRRDGRVVWIEGRPKVNYDASGQVVSVQDVIRDITAAKLADAAARQGEERLRAVTETITDILYTMDPDGVISFVTESCARLMGHPPQALIGARAIDLVHPDDADETMARYNAYLNAGPGAARITLQYRVRRSDGSWIWIEGKPKGMFDAAGALVCIHDVVRDISERKAVELELAEARRAAEAAAKAKSDFLANMSHEIRTPLTAILGFSTILQGVDGMPGEAQTYVRRIAAGGHSLLAIVNDILDFSKLEARQLALDPQPFDPTAFVEAAADLVAAQAQAKGLTLEAGFEGAAPAWLLADAARLSQVVLNLLSNAIKFTAEGRVSLRARYDDAAGRLVLAVSDTGPGISAEQQARLFERFSQADNSVSRRHGGTGLGVAISRRLVELMGGGVALSSSPGAGSVFTVSLPAPISEPPAERAAAREAGPAQAVRVLVVDDRSENRELVRLMLQAVGHHIEEAAGGAEAVAMAGETGFDLILMDIQMPGMDGLTAARKIREAAGPNAQTPIVALSASVLADQVNQCLAAGMNDHVAKPIQIAALLETVARWTEGVEAA